MEPFFQRLAAMSQADQVICLTAIIILMLASIASVLYSMLQFGTGYGIETPAPNATTGAKSRYWFERVVVRPVSFQALAFTFFANAAWWITAY